MIKYYDCWKHGPQVGDHCPQCVVHCYLPSLSGGLGSNRAAMDNARGDRDAQKEGLNPRHRSQASLLTRVTAIMNKYDLDLSGPPPEWLKAEMVAKLNRTADYLSSQALIQSTIDPDLCVGFAMATLKVQDIVDEMEGRHA